MQASQLGSAATCSGGCGARRPGSRDTATRVMAILSPVHRRALPGPRPRRASCRAVSPGWQCSRRVHEPQFRIVRSSRPAGAQEQRRSVDRQIWTPHPCGILRAAVQPAPRLRAPRVAGRSGPACMLVRSTAWNAHLLSAPSTDLRSSTHESRLHRRGVEGTGRCTRGCTVHGPWVGSCAVHVAGRSTRGRAIQQPCLHSGGSQGRGRWIRGRTIREHGRHSHEALGACIQQKVRSTRGLRDPAWPTLLHTSETSGARR